MMRDLIAAFGAAAREQMTAAGWRKRSGDSYTFDFGDGFLATLGLNRAVKHHPLRINPVVGVRHDALQRLIAQAHRGPHGPADTTLSRPIGYLTPANTFLQLEVATVQDATPTAQRLRDLVEHYGLPFARQHADVESLETALRGTGLVANPDWGRFLLTALLFQQGRTEEARAYAADELAKGTATGQTWVMADYRPFVDRLITHYAADYTSPPGYLDRSH